MRRLLDGAVLAAVLLALTGFLWTAPAALAQSAPSTQLDDQGQATVIVPVLNVRSGPGTGFSIQDHMAGGTALTVLAKNAGGDWLQVRTPSGLVGWVNAALVSRSAAPASYPGSPTRIVAPRIGLDSRVVPTGWHEIRNANGSVSSEWDVPSFAAGWLINSSKPGEVGNVVLSGHHNIEGMVFRYVVNLNAGDTVTLYVGNQAYNYTVTDKMILPDKYVSAEQRLQNARWIGSFADQRLTLVTCWPFTNNTHRVVVIAKPAAAH